jgi:hypothetical protein
MNSDEEVQRRLVLDCPFLLKAGLLGLLQQRNPAYYSIAVTQDGIDFSPD